MSDAIKHITDDIFSFMKATHWCTCIVHATESNWCGALDFLSPEPCPSLNSPEMNALITRFRESYSSVSMSHESKKTEETKWQCTDTASEWKMWFMCFPVLPGSAEAHVVWGGTEKRLLIAYFIGNISTQKYQNAFMCVKVIANQKWDVFETQCNCI